MDLDAGLDDWKVILYGPSVRLYHLTLAQHVSRSVILYGAHGYFCNGTLASSTLTFSGRVRKLFHLRLST
jgi:hypothetical protein